MRARRSAARPATLFARVPGTSSSRRCCSARTWIPSRRPAASGPCCTRTGGSRAQGTPCSAPTISRAWRCSWRCSNRCASKHRAPAAGASVHGGRGAVLRRCAALRFFAVRGKNRLCARSDRPDRHGRRRRADDPFLHGGGHGARGARGLCAGGRRTRSMLRQGGLVRLRQGRLEGGTTLNVGLISGGAAANIVPERCVLSGEIRSMRHDRALALYDALCEEYSGRRRRPWAPARVNCDVPLRAYRAAEMGTPSGAFSAPAQQSGFRAPYRDVRRQRQRGAAGARHRQHSRRKRDVQLPLDGRVHNR